jgi:Holliday junction resolvasome RuvABC endonuclease subunit
VKVLGLDLSLTATGWAVLSDVSAAAHGVIRSKATARFLKPSYKLKRAPHSGDFVRKHSDVAARLAQIIDSIEAVVTLECDLNWGELDLIVVESPSYGSVSSSLDQLWGLYWATLVQLQRSGVPIATVSPNARAQYATGNGAAPKASVVSASVRTYTLSYSDDNEVDATVLAAMGLRHLGAPLERELPQSHLNAMSSTLWPNKEIE